MLKQIYELIKEFKVGYLYAVAGRPVMGKTTVCWHIAKAFASVGKKVLYIKTDCIIRNEKDSCVMGRCDFVYQPDISVDEVERMIVAGSYNVAIIDEFQRMRHQNKAKTAKKLKCVAKKHNALIMVVSNISRRAERRKNHKPKVSDMTPKLCGSLAKKCKAVVLLYRGIYYDNSEILNVMEFTVVKGFFQKKKTIKENFYKMIAEVYGERFFNGER